MSRIDPWRRDWLSPGGRGWACRVVRVTGFRFHDLRHYFASLLIADGLDVKTVQARLRHASAKTTLDVYGHMWPAKDEASCVAVAAAIAARPAVRDAAVGEAAER
jgi:integrase